MRRIAGHSWEKTLAHEIEAHDQTRLEANLRILIQVANATAAAHARGIVLRDLKPANVMLGKYGEVYVVDWGIAAALEAVEHLDIPVLSSNPVVDNTVVGTPCYMAPEMLTGHATRATDVYLLGAIAFELATGKAPHEASSMTAAVASILMSPPGIPDSIDDELAKLIRKALSYEPAERFASAAEFSGALERYLRNRNSVQTARMGLVELSQLEARAALGAEVSSTEIEGLLGIARFSFQAALREWRDNTVAKSGLSRAYVAAGRHALASGDPERALTIAQSGPLDALGEENLVVLRADAECAVEEHRRELARLTARGDTATGGKTRAFVALLTCSIWFVGPAWAWWHVRATGQALSHEVVIASVLQILLWTILVVWARQSMTKTSLNRSIVRVGFLIPAYLGGLDLLLSQAGYAEHQIASLAFIGFDAMLLVVAIFVANGTFAIGAGLATFFCALGVRWPEWRYPAVLLANTSVFLAASLIALRTPQSVRK
jgi:eukaryotic-like serine/threonine-protein kinase